MRGLVVIAVLTGCTSSTPTQRAQSPQPEQTTARADALAAADAAPKVADSSTTELPAQIEAIVAAKSTTCIVTAARNSMDVGQIAAKGWHPVEVVRAGMFAHALIPGLSDGDQWRAWADAANRLADYGDIEGARIALDRAAAIATSKKLPVMRLDEATILAGRPVPPEKHSLDDVPVLVRAGQRERAAEVFEAKDQRRAGYAGLFNVSDMTRALVALDRTSEILEMAKGRKSEELGKIHRAWVGEAMRQKKPLAGPIAALQAWRATNSSLDTDIVDTLAGPAIVFGQAGAFDELRRDIRKTHVAKKSSIERDTMLVFLYRLALALPDRAEADLLAKELTKAVPIAKKQQPVAAAVYGGSLDDGLAAVKVLEAGELRDVYGALLWLRHVQLGFDPELDTRLVVALCP